MAGIREANDLLRGAEAKRVARIPVCSDTRVTMSKGVPMQNGVPVRLWVHRLALVAGASVLTACLAGEIGSHERPAPTPGATGGSGNPGPGPGPGGGATGGMPGGGAVTGGMVGGGATGGMVGGGASGGMVGTGTGGTNPPPNPNPDPPPPPSRPPVFGDPGCGLGKAAFCDTFDTAKPGGRGGDIDETRWAVARVAQFVN